MPPRANWKGYLKLSLVSCAVALFPAASSSERVSFHLLNRATGNRLKQQYVDAETGEIVEREDRVKGYEIAKGDYITVTNEELSEIEIESTHTIDIESFVPRSEVDPVYFDSRYYIAPDDKVGAEAFAVIREAMRRKDMAGIGRVVLYGRERMVLLEPRSAGIMGTTLHYDYEVRDDAGYFESIPKREIGKEMIDLATHIIDVKSAKFAPSKFKDNYQEAVADLIRAKQAGRPIQVSQTPRTSNVINLMDALRRSLGADKDTKDKMPSERNGGVIAAKTKPGAARPTKQSHSSRAKKEPRKGRVRKAS